MKKNIEKNTVAFSIVRDLLLEGNTVKVTVQGNSMLPFFTSGSTVELRPVKDSDLRKYSVVFADAGAHFVIHRIISVDKDNITLLGDGNIVGTETMSRDKVYGTIDCSLIHIFFSKIWLLMRPFRRYPLAVLRRIYK